MERAGGHHQESQFKHVVLAIWVINFLQIFISKSMGVLLPVLLDQFAAQTRNVGVILSLVFFTGNLIGKCLCIFLWSLHLLLFILLYQNIHTHAHTPPSTRNNIYGELK